MAFWNPMTISAAIQAGSSLLGGALGGDSGPSVTKSLKMLDAQRLRSQWDAQSMPSFMAQGAKNAGLHPSVVFGAGGYQPSPVQAFPMYESDNKSQWGSILANTGQNVSRAMFHGLSADDRNAAVQQATEAQYWQNKIPEEQWGNANLQNQLLALQIRKLANEVTPPAPEPHGTVTIGDPITQSMSEVGQYSVDPAKVISANPHIRSLTAGPESPSMTRYRFGGPNLGFNYELPSGSSASEALESMGAPFSTAITMGHNILRSADRLFNGDPSTRPSDKLLPRGYYWHYKPISRTWQARPIDNKERR